MKTDVTASNLELKITQVFCLAIFLLLSGNDFVQAQNVSPPLSPQTQPVEPEILQPLEEILPELEKITPQDSVPVIKDIPRQVLVEQFTIIGSTVFTPEELAVLLKPYSMRRISFTELLAAQQAIDRLYFDHGYITSGTFIPPQKLQDGTVVIEVLEGTIEEIRIEGLDRLNPNYVRSRLQVATKAPLNYHKLLKALQLLHLDPLIKTVAAELTAGTKPGSSILEINLQEADPFDLRISTDNYRAPSVGSNRRQIELTHRNLFGWGDRFNIAYLNTDGSDSLSDLSYRLPINPHNGTLKFRYSYTDSKIVESPFDRFNIEADSNKYEFTYRQPLLQKPTEDFALGISFTRNDSNLTQDGIPASIGQGIEADGETHISALRFFQEYTTRNAKEVFAFRSQLSLGIDAFDATVSNEDIPDSEFLAWNLQAQYLRLLSPDITLVLRSHFQLANDDLLVEEKYSLGGVFSVRGYRQDALLGDNGLFNSAELRINLIPIPQWETSLQLTPFVDFGKVWSSGNQTYDKNTLVSVGVGLRLEVRDDFAARLDWGIPLVDKSNNGNTLQEEGIYFSVEFKPF